MVHRLTELRGGLQLEGNALSSGAVEGQFDLASLERLWLWRRRRRVRHGVVYGTSRDVPRDLIMDVLPKSRRQCDVDGGVVFGGAVVAAGAVGVRGRRAVFGGHVESDCACVNWWYTRKEESGMCKSSECGWWDVTAELAFIFRE